MAYGNQERRRYPRIDVGIAVDYHVLGVIENVSFGQTKNSSVGGFMLMTKDQFNRGTCLVLEVPWPSRLTPVRLLGRVISSAQSENSVSFDTRIEFLAIDDEHKKLIAELTEYYTNKKN